MMSNQRAYHSKHSLKNNNSPATSYCLSALEEKSHRINSFSSSTQVANAFSSLDEILPHCGIYTPLLKAISDELKEAVYSNTYSASNGNSKLERIPYFTLLQRLRTEKEDSKSVLSETKENYNTEIQKLEERIVDKEKKLLDLRTDLLVKESEANALNQQLAEKKGELIKIEKDLSLIRQLADEEISHLNITCQNLVSSKLDLKTKIEEMRHYKVSYHTLKDTFDLPVDKRPRRGFRRPVISTKKTHLLSGIEAASKLEQQMIEGQSKSLEEYDLFLEDVKTQLGFKKFSKNENERDFFTEELQLENLKNEMNAKLASFQRLITGIVVELELIREHRDALQSHLSQMEQAENIATGDAASNAGTLPPSSMAGGPGSSRLMTHEEAEKKMSLESHVSLESGLEEDTTSLIDPTTDPFNPQEKLLSKYSAMLYTSTNAGKSFDEISSAKYCVSCGEKTCVCPHKVTKADVVIKLPPGCTHIKIARPAVRKSLPSVTQHGGYLYRFMSERYQEEDTSTVATYDFITGIVKYAEQDKEILLLGHVLAGLADGASIRFSLVIADLIDEAKWQSTYDFRTFAEIVYSFLEEDEVDQLVLEYNAFSENKISKCTIMNFLVYLITKHKEPRLIEAESKIALYPKENAKNMTKDEFLVAMEGICPLHSEDLLLKLVIECMHSVGSEVVPINRLACASKLPTSESLVAENGTITTMTQVKQLANNISRLRHSGNGQSQQSIYDEVYWQAPTYQNQPAC